MTHKRYAVNEDNGRVFSNLIAGSLVVVGPVLDLGGFYAQMHAEFALCM